MLINACGITNNTNGLVSTCYRYCENVCGIVAIPFCSVPQLKRLKLHFELFFVLTLRNGLVFPLAEAMLYSSATPRFPIMLYFTSSTLSSPFNVQFGLYVLSLVLSVCVHVTLERIYNLRSNDSIFVERHPHTDLLLKKLSNNMRKMEYALILSHITRTNLSYLNLCGHASFVCV